MVEEEKSLIRKRPGRESNYPRPLNFISVNINMKLFYIVMLLLSLNFTQAMTIATNPNRNLIRDLTDKNVLLVGEGKCLRNCP